MFVERRGYILRVMAEKEGRPIRGEVKQYLKMQGRSQREKGTEKTS